MSIDRLAAIQHDVDIFRTQFNAYRDLVDYVDDMWPGLDPIQKQALQDEARSRANRICELWDLLIERYLEDDFWPEGRDARTHLMAWFEAIDQGYIYFLSRLGIHLYRLHDRLPEEIEWGSAFQSLTYLNAGYGEI